MTKGKLIELVRRKLAVKVHDLVISEFIDIVFSQYIGTIMQRGGDLSAYLARKRVSIIRPSSGLAYVETPIGCMTNGVRFGNLISGEYMALMLNIMSQSEYEVLSGLEALGIDNETIAGIRLPDRIEFVSIPDSIESVDVLYVKLPGAYGVDDELMLPSGMEEQFIQDVINMVSNAPADKKSNDNTNLPV